MKVFHSGLVRGSGIYAAGHSGLLTRQTGVGVRGTVEQTVDPFAAWARVYDIDDIPVPEFLPFDPPSWPASGIFDVPLAPPPGFDSLALSITDPTPIGIYSLFRQTNNLTRIMRAADDVEIPQPFTLAFTHWANATTSRIWLSSKDTAAYLRHSTAGITLNAGANLATGALATSTWRVGVAHANGANSAIWLNNALAASGNAGTGPWTDMQVGGQWNAALGAPVRTTWIGITSGLVDPAEVSALLMDRFGITA